MAHLVGSQSVHSGLDITLHYIIYITLRTSFAFLPNLCCNYLFLCVCIKSTTYNTYADVQYVVYDNDVGCHVVSNMCNVQC